MTMKPSHIIFLLAVVALASHGRLLAQGEEPLPPPGDSTHAAADTVFHVFVPKDLGTLDGGLDSTTTLTHSALAWIDARSLTDVLATQPGFIIRDQQSIGQYSAPTIRGIDWRSTAVLMNGRTLADPATGYFDPQHTPEGTIENVEVVTGPRAFLYGLNSTGGAVNVVTRNYNSNRAYTRLRYAQSGYEYTTTDGTFSQNVSRRVNITAGFQHQGTDGRFDNSVYDWWDFRGKIRYGVNEHLAAVISENFTSTYTDLNGGVNLDKSYYALDPNQATVVNTDSYEKITRHDVDAALAGSFFDDTTATSTLQIYYSSNLREYRDEENRSSPNGIFVQEDHRSSWMGGRFSQFLTVLSQRLNLGGEVELRQVEGSPTIGRHRRVLAAAWLKDEWTWEDRLDLAAYGRIDHFEGRTRQSLGGDAALRLTEVFSLTGGVSLSHRLPNFTEEYWSDSTVSRTGTIEPERHTLVQAGVRAGFNSDATAAFTLTHRVIDHPILAEYNGAGPVFPLVQFTNGSRQTLTTADIAFSVRHWILLWEGTGTFFIRKLNDEDLPRVWLTGGVYWRDTLFHSNLDIKAGFRGWYRSEHRGMIFNPQVGVYVPNPGPKLGQAATVDFVLVAHIGDAFIHLVWENLPGIYYYASPYYPGLDRELRLDLAWDFWN